MTKMLKIELYVIPFNDMSHYNTEDILKHLKEGRVEDLGIHIGDVKQADIGEWSDDHKLNKKGIEIWSFRHYFEPPDIKIRRVDTFGDRLYQQAIDMGLKDNDICLVTTTIPEGGSLPIFNLEKIEGNPTEWLQKRFLGDEPITECKIHKGYTYYGTTCPICDTDKENKME